MRQNEMIRAPKAARYRYEYTSHATNHHVDVDSGRHSLEREYQIVPITTHSQMNGYTTYRFTTANVVVNRAQFGPNDPKNWMQN
mmetsp:Transcript_17105/g.30647  ORF Transcript_17105/g.30647 Transcript_17105/m.30647 type:complete len:84 (-) Transcript_17105:474-725(-)